MGHFLRGKKFPTAAAIETALGEYFTENHPHFTKKKEYKVCQRDGQRLSIMEITVLTLK